MRIFGGGWPDFRLERAKILGAQTSDLSAKKFWGASFRPRSGRHGVAVTRPARAGREAAGRVWRASGRHGVCACSESTWFVGRELKALGFLAALRKHLSLGGALKALGMSACPHKHLGVGVLRKHLVCLPCSDCTWVVVVLRKHLVLGVLRKHLLLGRAPRALGFGGCSESTWVWGVLRGGADLTPSRELAGSGTQDALGFVKQSPTTIPKNVPTKI